MNALNEQFLAAEIQVLGLSVDSKHSHKAWAGSFGGIKYPILADFHPKGEVAKAYGLWVPAAGISARATVIIDKSGTVVWSEAVESGGMRNPSELLATAKASV